MPGCKELNESKKRENVEYMKERYGHVEIFLHTLKIAKGAVDNDIK